MITVAAAYGAAQFDFYQAGRPLSRLRKILETQKAPCPLIRTGKGSPVSLSHPKLLELQILLGILRINASGYFRYHIVKTVSLVVQIFYWSKHLELVEPACVDNQYLSAARSSSPQLTVGYFGCCPPALVSVLHASVICSSLLQAKISLAAPVVIKPNSVLQFMGQKRPGLFSCTVDRPAGS
jgi:hypothetical protein